SYTVESNRDITRGNQRSSLDRSAQSGGSIPKGDRRSSQVAEDRCGLLHRQGGAGITGVVEVGIAAEAVGNRIRSRRSRNGVRVEGDRESSVAPDRGRR